MFAIKLRLFTENCVVTPSSYHKLYFFKFNLPFTTVNCVNYSKRDLELAHLAASEFKSDASTKSN